MKCPDCLWESPEYKYYVLKNNTIEKVIFDNSIIGTVYPLILEKSLNHHNRYTWREVHRCPKCLFEFEQTKVDN